MDVKIALIDEAREKELFTRTLYRTYLTTGILWGDFHLIIGITNRVAATLAGTSALADSKNITILFSILAALATFLNSGERGKVHIKIESGLRLRQ